MNQTLESILIIDNHIIKMNPNGILFIGKERTFDDWITYYDTNQYETDVIAKELMDKFIYLIRSYYPKYFDNQVTISYFLKNQTLSSQLTIRQKIIDQFQLLKEIEKYQLELNKNQTDLNNISLEIYQLETRLTTLKSLRLQYQSNILSLSEYVENKQTIQAKIETEYNIADFNLKLFEASRFENCQLQLVGFNSKSLILYTENKEKINTLESLTEFIDHLQLILNISENECIYFRNITSLQNCFYEVQYELRKKKRKYANRNSALDSQNEDENINNLEENKEN